METNKKTDWQQFLVINSWRLHLSLRAHMNYIVAVWTFKRSDVINLFRVTMGSVWSQGFFTCGIAVLQPHLQDTFCSCPEVLPGGKEGCGHASLSSIFLRGSSLCMHWDQKLSSVSQQVSHECRTDPCPAWAFLGSPGAVAAVAAPTCPSQTTIAFTPGLERRQKDPSSAAPLELQITDFSFLAVAKKPTDIFFLFCSANISCKLKPNIFRYLNKRGKKGIHT